MLEIMGPNSRAAGSPAQLKQAVTKKDTAIKPIQWGNFLVIFDQLAVFLAWLTTLPSEFL
jgi:hypothetical protein